MKEFLEITISGMVCAVSPYVSIGAPFLEEIMRIARASGLHAFRVFVNGRRIEHHTCPAIIEKGMVIKLIPYDYSADATADPEMKLRSAEAETTKVVKSRRIKDLDKDLVLIGQEVEDISQRWGLKEMK